MNHFEGDKVIWMAVITVIALLIAGAGYVIMQELNPEHAPNVEVHMCDYKACCEDQTDNCFDCDSTGCPNVIPNWTHPNCREGGP